MCHIYAFNIGLEWHSLVVLMYLQLKTHFIMTYSLNSQSWYWQTQTPPTPQPLPLANRKDAQHVVLYSTGWLSANRHEHTLGLIMFIWPSSLAPTHWVTVSKQAKTKIVSMIHPFRPSAALSHAWLTEYSLHLRYNQVFIIAYINLLFNTFSWFNIQQQIETWEYVLFF